MTTQQKQILRARLAALNEGDPLWEGLKAYVEEMVKDTVDASSRAGLTPDDRAFNDGRQSMGSDILQAFEDEWEIAHRLPETQS